MESNSISIFFLGIWYFLKSFSDVDNYVVSDRNTIYCKNCIFGRLYSRGNGMLNTFTCTVIKIGSCIYLLQEVKIILYFQLCIVGWRF